MDFNFDFYGLALIFLLGLRHGLDPDHIAVIDSLSFQSIQRNSKLAPWIGTFFALGHGLTITLVAMLVSAAGGYFSISQQSSRLLEWIPILLLLLTAVLNLNLLLGNKTEGATGWRHRLLSKKLNRTAKPFTLLLVGVLFALVFDTATQLAAWSYTASNSHSLWHALLIGLVFTAGMVVTDTLEARLLFRVSQKAASRPTVGRYRRNLGWIIVLSALVIAIYKGVTQFFPSLELSETGNLMAGLVMVALVLLTYVQVFFHLRKKEAKNGY